MNIKLDSGAFALERAHPTDAGLDIRARANGLVRAGSACVFRTGVHVELPAGTAGLIVSKSGLNVKHNITSTGLIDEGYSGEIVVKLFNHGAEDYFVKAGDKISQMVVIPVLYEPVEIVDDLRAGERGESGFGSSGR